MMEALSSSETSVDTRDTCRNIPEDAILHSHQRDNLNSFMKRCVSELYSSTDVKLLFLVQNSLLACGIEQLVNKIQNCHCLSQLTRCKSKPGNINTKVYLQYIRQLKVDYAKSRHGLVGSCQHFFTSRLSIGFIMMILRLGLSEEAWKIAPLCANNNHYRAPSAVMWHLAIYATEIEYSGFI
jgi:hypothetical protein